MWDFDWCETHVCPKGPTVGKEVESPFPPPPLRSAPKLPFSSSNTNLLFPPPRKDRHMKVEFLCWFQEAGKGELDGLGPPKMENGQRYTLLPFSSTSILILLAILSPERDINNSFAAAKSPYFWEIMQEHHRPPHPLSLRHHCSSPDRTDKKEAQKECSFSIPICFSEKISHSRNCSLSQFLSLQEALFSPGKNFSLRLSHAIKHNQPTKAPAANPPTHKMH